MAVRGCTLVAIEGTHASGKTTLVHALVGHYRARGVLVDCVGEPARSSPFIEETVIHGQGEFDLACEVDLFAAQLSAQLRAARHQQLLVCDKTILNVLAYAHIVLDPDDGHTAAVVEAMSQFCRAWAHVYDAVFYCPDQYRQPDPLRAKVSQLQGSAAGAVRDVFAHAGVDLIDVPSGLSVDYRVAWVTQRVDPLLRRHSD
jgi:hypothetical protein